MAAEFTTDPAALAPRRVTADVTGSLSDPFAVGCGYAAHTDWGGGAFIVRLSDGASVLLPRQPHWVWSDAIGVTCEDVYYRYGGDQPGDPGLLDVARLHIVDLGPWQPAS